MVHKKLGYASIVFALIVSASTGSALAGQQPANSTRLDDNGSSGIAAIVDREARANGIPIALARAVVRIESNWNAGLTGGAGEVGLMQIKHPTAKGIGYEGSRAALYDPATNVKWGMRYLAGAYRMAGGDTCGTVMRYQGGYGAKRMSGAAKTYCSKARTIMASN
jgi:soluble lytic murein transglycosylase-like protein